MTLKEKFGQTILNQGFYIDWNKARQCEEIADEFSIGFAEWCIYYREKNRNVYGDILHSLSKYDETYTTKELLEIYKKGNGH